MNGNPSKTTRNRGLCADVVDDACIARQFCRDGSCIRPPGPAQPRGLPQQPADRGLPLPLWWRGRCGNKPDPTGNRLAPAQLSPSRSSGNGAFADCTQARAAGSAPVRRGDPGYGPHLDRDNDGIGLLTDILQPAGNQPLAGLVPTANHALAHHGIRSRLGSQPAGLLYSMWAHPALHQGLASGSGP